MLFDTFATLTAGSGLQAICNILISNNVSSLNLLQLTCQEWKKYYSWKVLKPPGFSMLIMAELSRKKMSTAELSVGHGHKSVKQLSKSDLFPLAHLTILGQWNGAGLIFMVQKIHPNHHITPARTQSWENNEQFCFREATCCLSLAIFGVVGSWKEDIYFSLCDQRGFWSFC